VFAATYPGRTTGLVLINSYSRRIRTDDYPWAPTIEEWEGFLEAIRDHWGEPLFAEILAPSMAADSGFLTWWATYLRRSVSPGAALAILRMNAELDIRAILPAIHVPTLVIHRVGDRINPVGGARHLAAQITGARLVEVPGEDHHFWNGEMEPILGELEAFVTGGRRQPAGRTMLATLLFTDIVDSTRKASDLGDHRWNTLLETHDGLIRRELARFQGREIKMTGDGVLALFDGPARAISCALAIRNQLREVGVEIRAGVHTSEVELVADDVRGVGVHVAARVMALGGAGEVLITSVVRDLAFGSGLTFTDRGTHHLKGVPGEWRLYSVTTG
jgi:class 3 adenylate cyclase